MMSSGGAAAINRRQFLKVLGAGLGTLALSPALAQGSAPPIRVGLLVPLILS